MSWRPLLLALLALPTATADLEPYAVLLDWTEGHTLAPTTPFASTPLADAFTFEAPACYPHLLLDLQYDPAEAGIDIEGAGSAAIAYEFRVEVRHNDSVALERRIQHPGLGHPLGALDEVGPHELRLSLGWGANVSWEMRLRARLATEDPACNPPLEATG